MQPVRIVPASTTAFDAANDAWERGDYIAALNGYLQVLNAPGGERFLEPIALTTGELFETRELTADGRAPRFSPDGRLHRVRDRARDVASHNDPDERRRSGASEVAELRWRVGDVLAAAWRRSRICGFPITRRSGARPMRSQQASLTAQNRNQLTQTLTWLVAKHAAIVVRDLGTGREMELPTPDLLKTGLAFSADGRLLYFLGAKESEPDRTDVYVISEGSAASRDRGATPPA